MVFGTPGFALESVLTLDEAKALLGDGVACGFRRWPSTSTIY